MKALLTIFVLFYLPIISTGQNQITALRIDEKISIDGKLDEGVWSNAEKATNFINWNPTAGTVPSEQSEFMILYDDNAVYVGAHLHARSRADIKTELSERDDIGNTDWIGVIIDTYGNGTEAAEFILAATGVQFDAKVTSTNGEDSEWNEVWYSAVTLTETGWYAEIKIPYFALRFPKTESQSWRVNFMRRIAKTGEKSSFEFIDPEVNGFINQTAYLKGVNNIKSPLRLSLSPYLTGYFQHDKFNDASASGYSYSGGLDLKYGINEAFTLDMTLVPDFGQVRSDDQVLNLSPFEIQFGENRAFFTEGLDLFSKANLFYSRRVGGRPVGLFRVSDELAVNEIIEANPAETQLYNATKVSGRNKNGLGVGVFNAIAGSTHASIRNTLTDEIRNIETNPLTNYNILVLDQNLANNSFIYLINTNVWRNSDTFHNANVTGIEFDLRTKNQVWGIDGSSSYSQLIFDEADNIYGLRYSLRAGKRSGNLTYGINASGTSASYDHNDLGYFTRSDIRDYNVNVAYSVFDGWKSFNRLNVWFNTSLGTTYEENDFRNLHFNSGFWGQLKSQWELNMWTNYEPESIDYFEARREGQIVRRPGFYNMGWWIGSDSRKPFRITFNPFFMKYFDEGASIMEFYINPRYRFSDKFTISFTIGYEDNYNLLGYVRTLDNGEIIMGRRDLQNIENVFRMTYIFNSKMSLNLRARHDWSKVRYDGEFYGLDRDGRRIETAYDDFNDFSAHFFNLDLNYTWRFAPGSDLIFVWKNTVGGSISDSSINYNKYNYFSGLSGIGDLPSQNSISIRLVYFLNTQSLIK